MKTKKKVISFAIPCFNEEENVEPVYRELTKVIDKRYFKHELVYVDNGSTDRTRDKIKQLAKRDRQVKGIFLSRNFGPEASVQAAVDHTTGEAVIVYEADMQDPPEKIPDLIKAWESGYDVVVGIRTKIEDNVLMALARRLFYKIFKSVSNIDVPVNAGSFSIMSRRVARELRRLPESYRFYRGLRAWVGFKTKYITYERQRRKRGKSWYSFWRYMQHAERSFFGFSYLPLDLMVYTGVLLVTASFLFLFIYLVFWLLIYQNPLNIFIVIIAAIVLFGGVELLAISLVGKYIQVIVEETKHRPTYIVDTTINC